MLFEADFEADFAREAATFEARSLPIGRGVLADGPSYTRAAATLAHYEVPA